MQNFKISIPCKSYIRKYFCYRFGSIGDTISLNSRTDIDETILTKINYKPVKKISKGDLSIYLRQLDSKISFSIPIDMLYRIDTSVTPHQVYSINRYMETVFKSDLHFIIQIAMVFGISKVTAAKSFLVKYDITDEEISIEAIKKSYYRRKSSHFAKSFFLAGMSSPFSDMNEFIPGQGRIRSD